LQHCSFLRFQQNYFDGSIKLFSDLHPAKLFFPCRIYKGRFRHNCAVPISISVLWSYRAQTKTLDNRIQMEMFISNCDRVTAVPTIFVAARSPWSAMMFSRIWLTQYDSSLMCLNTFSMKILNDCTERTVSLKYLKI